MKMINEYGAAGGMRTGRGNLSTRRKPAPVPLCTPQTPYDVSWDRTRAAGVGSRRLTLSWRGGELIIKLTFLIILNTFLLLDSLSSVNISHKRRPWKSNFELQNINRNWHVVTFSTSGLIYALSILEY
jgi:hypothetical protein